MDMADPMDPVAAGWASYYAGLLRERREGALQLAVLTRLRRARQHMSAGPALEKPLDLAAMASAAHFSKFHFLRLFRQAYGETPARYRSQARLERARVLLETTDRSITDICLDVGFASLPSFSGAFRKHTGRSPQHYRRSQIAVPRAIKAARLVPGCFVAMYAAIRPAAT
jgi:transcriptional regulator GlxA family with amidase domain